MVGLRGSRYVDEVLFGPLGVMVPTALLDRATRVQGRALCSLSNSEHL